MAQQVEHVLGKDEVTGSNPVSSSIVTLPSSRKGFVLATNNTAVFFGKENGAIAP